MNTHEKIVVFNIRKQLRWYDRIIMHIFKNYTLKIYKMGVQYGYNWKQ